MKRMMKLLIAALMVAMVSLVITPDAVAREKKAKQPCQKEGLSTKEEIRAHAQASSVNAESARQKALASARATMGFNVEFLLKAVNEQYISDYEVGIADDYRSSFNQIARDVTQKSLRFAIPICEEVLQDTKTKQYTVHVALALKGADLAKMYEDAVSADEKLRTDFEREKFLKTYNDEMEKFEKATK